MIRKRQLEFGWGLSTLPRLPHLLTTKLPSASKEPKQSSISQRGFSLSLSLTTSSSTLLLLTLTTSSSTLLLPLLILLIRITNRNRNKMLHPPTDSTLYPIVVRVFSFHFSTSQHFHRHPYVSNGFNINLTSKSNISVILQQNIT